MRKQLLKVISVLLTLTLLSVYLPVFAQVSDLVESTYEQVELWKRTDVILKSDVTYQNPYKDVEIDATFTHEDGTKISLYGFWNGEDEWRVRFAPTKLGVWSYKITCSNPDDTGLHNKTGKLLAVENTGDTALDQHGFVTISENGRYFTYDDGTPFYWLGDTHRQAPNYVTLTACNYPGCECGNQFLHEVNNRLEKGFTVYQTYFDLAELDGGGQNATTTEPSLWSEKYETINPVTFSNKIDVMFDTLAENGMTIALGIGTFHQNVETLEADAFSLAARYLTARYASYPVVWFTGYEAAAETQASIFDISADVVDAGDGYHHPQSAYQDIRNATDAYIEALDAETWHEFYALQSGHNTYPTKAYYEAYWNKDKLFIETVSGYEDVNLSGYTRYQNARITAWRANLLGSYGYTYGAAGIWANNYTTAGNTGWYPDYNLESWYMGLDKPGSFEMSYLRAFFEYADFATLVPRFSDTAYSSFTTENKLVASSDDGKTFVAYFCNETLSSGTLYGLNANETYTAKWYNPLTGKFIEIANTISAQNGSYTIPAKPTTGDWALIVTSRTDLGEYKTESAYTDDLIDTRINVAPDAAVTASSFNGADNNGDKAVDNNLSTYWCAANGDMPQVVTLDFGSVQSFAEIDLYFHSGSNTVSFTVEGSSDGEDYESFYTVTQENTTVKDGMNFFRITKDGAYRFLKFSFTEIITNWATLHELCVFTEAERVDTEEEPTPEDPNVLIGSVITTSGDGATTNPPSLTLDGDTTNYWVGNGYTDQWIVYNMGKQKTFNSLAIAMVGGTSSITYTVSGSNDNASWTTLSEGTSVTPNGYWGNACLYQFSFNSVSYQYLRIDFHSVSDQWATICEIEAGMDVNKIEVPKNIFVGATAEASGTFADYKPFLACDGSLSTFWCAPASNGHSISFTFNGEKTFDSLYLVAQGATEYTKLQIEISSDNADWSTIYNPATLAATEQVGGANAYRISFDRAYTANYMKISIDATAAGWITLAEIEGELSDSAVEEETPEVEIEEGNLLTGATASASSLASYDAPASAANDANTSSYWCGQGDTNQWIAFDLGTTKIFNKLAFTMFGGTTAINVTIETSQNGIDWAPIYTNESLTPVGTQNNSELFVIGFDQDYTARHIRVYLHQVTGNWATMVESELTYAQVAVDDTLPTYSGTLQTPGIQSTDSYYYSQDGLGSDKNDALIDAGVTTEWSPFSPIGTQTLVFDLYQATTLYGMNITLGEYAALPDYRIMASLDGEDWTILVDDTLRDPITYTVGGRTVLSEALSGNYRYIKLLWLGTNGNSDTKTIAEIEIFAEGATPTAPTAPDTTELVALYNAAKSLSNSQKRYSAPSFSAFSKARFKAGALLSTLKKATQEDVNAAQKALEDAYLALVERLGNETKDYLAYISTRTRGSSHDIRFVLSAKVDAINAADSLTVSVAFETANGTKTKSYTLSSDGIAEFGVYRTVTGGGKTYEAIGGNALFGLIVTDIPANAWNAVTLTVSDGANTLYQGYTTYSDLMD